MNTFFSFRHFSRRCLAVLSTAVFIITSVLPAAVAAGAQSSCCAPQRSPLKVNAEHAPNLSGQQLNELSPDPSDDEIIEVRLFPEPLTPMSGEPIPGENRALANALQAFAHRTDDDDVSALTAFVEEFPSSRWRASVEENLGQQRFSHGFFSDAFQLWQSAWDRSKHETGKAQKAVADEAVSQLLLLNSRVGRIETLKKLFAQIKGRPFYGTAEGRVSGVRDALSQMEHHPEFAFKCGPAALFTIANLGSNVTRCSDQFARFPSTFRGTNLASLTALAKQMHLNFRPAKRSPGAEIAIPSLVHWKAGHFAAITARVGEKFRVEDPTFGTNGTIIVSAKALDDETDGYFLVPADKLPANWKFISTAEASTIWGKGLSPNREQNSKTTWVPKVPFGASSFVSLDDEPSASTSPGQSTDESTRCHGMARASVFPASVATNITDVPLSYSPPIGKPIEFVVNYNYQEANQPSTFTFSNLGPNWSLNWISYVTGGSPTSGGPWTVSVRGGGAEAYSTLNSFHDMYSLAVLKQFNSTTFERDMPDGSKELFGTNDGTRYFMDTVIDPQGNQTKIAYDAHYRITSVTDAFGEVSTVSYPTNTVGASGYYCISKITDPFGRTATFTYDSTYTQLLSIVDQIGIGSVFTYSAASPSFISSMATPYGSTTFTQYTPSGTSQDSPVGLAVTFPDQTTARVENWIGYNIKSYYWNREMMELYPDDYANNVHTHCLTMEFQMLSGFVESGIINWVQPPLDNRRWYNYFGSTQSDSNYPDHFTVGTQTIALPTQILTQPPGYVPVYGLPPSSGLQTWTMSYGSTPRQSFGYATQVQDPLQRTFDYAYASNGIDLLSVKQDTTGEIISQSTYNSQHEPLTAIDGSGQTTQFTYNNQGQPLTVTDALGNATTLTYSGKGATIGGSVNTGDTKNLSITITNSALPGGSITKSYTVQTGDTLSTIASSLASAINSDTNLSSNNITATWVAAEPVNQTPVVYVNSFSSNSTTYSVGTTGTGSETITLASNTCGFLVKLQGPLASQISTLQYDSVGRVSSTTDPEGYSLSFTYDNFDRLLQTTFPDSTTQQIVYDKLDAVALKDRLNLWTLRQFDSMQKLTQQTDPAGRTSKYEWCGCGSLKSLTDPNGNTTTFSHDLEGRQIAKTYAGDSTTTVRYAYDLFSRLSSMTDPLNQVTSYQYNVDNSLASVEYSNTINPTPNVSYTYDNYFPRMVSVNDASGTAQYTYEYNCYPTATTNKAHLWIGGLPNVDPTGASNDTISLTFFNSSLSGGQYTLPTFTVPTGDQGSLSATVTDLVAAINADTTLSSHSITAAADNVSSPSRPNNIPHITISASSAVSVTASSTGATTATVAGAGRLSQILNSVISNATVSYSFDALGRTVDRMINGGINKSAFAYDAISRVTSETNPLGTFTYSYVDTNKGVPYLSSVSYPNGQTTTLTYGASPNSTDWRVARILNQTSTPTTLSQFDYLYDADGRIVQWEQQQNGSNLYETLGYDFSGQLVSAQTRSGAVGPPWNSQLYYSYDPAQNRTSVQSTTTLNVPTTVLKSQYNQLNQLTSITGGGAVRVSGTTDRAVQPVTVNDQPTFMNMSEQFSANADVHTGLNNVSVTAISGGGGSTTSDVTVHVNTAIPQTIAFDQNGNTTDSVDSTGVTTRKWDAANRLIEIDYPGSGNSTQLSYDGLSRCTKIIETSGGTVTSTRQFVWRATDRCEIRDGSGALVCQYFLLGQLNVSAGVDTDCYYTTDHLGSIREVTDNAGSIQSQYSYDPWGSPTKISGTGAESDFGFASMYVHRVSGLNLSFFRAYSPQFARWLSRDPFGEEAGANLYAYVLNNPLRFVDPLGLDAIVLTDPRGAFGLHLGHEAVLVGNDTDGWNLYSKSMIGFGGREAPPTFSNLEEAAAYLESQHPGKYREYNRFHTSSCDDEQMNQKAAELIGHAYDPICRNCVGFDLQVVRAGGIDIPAGAGLHLPNPTYQMLRGAADESGVWPPAAEPSMVP